jgi:uncharacterized repeat protein (TIGR01451 family)
MHPSPTSPRLRPWRPLAALALLAVPLIGATSIEPSLAQGVPDAHDFVRPVFSADARGDIATIGNVTTTCDPTYENDRWSTAESAAACLGATSGATGLVRHDGAPMPPINNRLSMRYVDVDEDATTFASSTADLTIPEGATVLWAGLHWNGATEVPAADQLYGSSDQTAPVAEGSRFRVRLRTPATSSYVALDAAPADGVQRDTWDDTNPGGTTSYGGFVDVTELVRAGGAGRYAVADVQSCTGFGGCFGSWSLTVAFAQESLPPRNLNVWHGWQLTTPTVADGAQEFEVDGIEPPPSGPVSARIGVVQADGDRGLGPDSLDISSPSSPTWRTFETVDRPLAPGEDDWFNSTVTVFGARRTAATASPNLLANLNHDIALVEDDEVIGNDDRSFRFRIQTASSESLYSQVVHSAVEIYAPEIAIDKEVAPGGPVAPGAEVTWTLRVRNAGIDPIRAATVTDPLPAGLELVPGSIRYSAGGPADALGPKTDAAGDDEARWDPGTRTLSFAIGAGTSADRGGTMGIAPAADGSHELTITYRTRVVGDPDAVLDNVATAHGLGRELDDPFGPLETRDEAMATTSLEPSADLGIAKSDGGAVVRAAGDRFTYVLEGRNAGPSPATGVTIADELDERLRFVDSDDGCQAEGQRVTCPVGDLAVDASATRSFVVEVVELPGPGRSIPNLASIGGDQPNPDCADPTPDAACNEASEETPQPAVDLGIDKDDGGAEVAAIGDRFTYGFEVTNAGPDDATGVRIDDELDPHIRFVASPTCVADGQVVTCLIGDLPAGGSAAAEVEVEVVALPEAGEEIPNLAAVHGAEPDPDCTDETPDARCNADEERTPRAEEPTPTTTTEPTTSTVPEDGPRRAVTPRGDLVRTGATVVLLAAIGVGSIALGTWMMAARRRRREDPFW